MNGLDVVLVLVVLAYAVSGYWQGFITGAFATVGLLTGGFLGIWLTPTLFGDAGRSLWVSLGALMVVLVSASIGQALLQWAGARVRARIRWQPIRSLDAVGGSVLSVLAVLVVSWALGVALSGTRLPWISEQVRTSSVLSRVDEVMPRRAVEALGSFNSVVGSSFFPRYLQPFQSERIPDAGPPPAGIARDPEIARASASVVKVRGQNSCRRGIEGSGFVYGPGRVITNAHVVAGVDNPTVENLQGEQAGARVVVYDPDLDLAVLAVDGLDAPPLSFETEASSGMPAAVLGFPQDGPYRVEPARIRSDQRLRSPDIYGSGTVVREVWSVRARIRPGNSGGPLVNRDGDVLGVVFAASVSDEVTGYALTAGQVAAVAAEGLGARAAVSSGGCA